MHVRAKSCEWNKLFFLLQLSQLYESNKNFTARTFQTNNAINLSFAQSKFETLSYLNVHVDYFDSLVSFKSPLELFLHPLREVACTSSIEKKSVLINLWIVESIPNSHLQCHKEKDE